MSTSPASPEQITRFWIWFASIASELSSDFRNVALLEELDRRVTALGDVMWEIGPGSTAENMLAISRDGDASLLPLTRAIVGWAPAIPNWEFLPARPAKPEPLAITLRDDVESEDEREVDAHPWRYALLPAGNAPRTSRLIVEANNLPDATEEERYYAAVIVVEGLLGELVRLERVDSIEVVTRLESGDDARPITELKAHVLAAGRVTVH